MEALQTITVFYSWQSDLDAETNSRAIRKALKSAKAKVEKSNDNVIINVDEATSNTAGSPEISQNIFEKISECDIFVCDISIINSEATNSRKTPNPNVLIELGYAIATLGFERIVMLFNVNYGTLNDLPFDLERKRITKVKVNKDSLDNDVVNLSNTLRDAIKTIIEKNPIKARSLINTDFETEIRKRDIEIIENIFRLLHFDTFYEYASSFPKYISFDFVSSIGDLIEAHDRYSFLIDNVELKKLIDDFIETLFLPRERGNYYFPSPNSSGYTFDSNQENQFVIFNELTENCRKMEKALKELFAYVNKNYLEVDINRTNTIAYKRLNPTSENN